MALRILLAQGGEHLLRVAALAQALEFIDVDADGHGPRPHAAAEGLEDVVLAALGARLVVHVAGEVRQVGVALEADQVVGEERAHQPFVLRNGGHDQRRRQWDVQEEAHALLATQGAQLGGQRNEVVVVDPHQVFGPQQRGQPVREQAVDTAVAVDVAAVEFGQVEPVVEYRPQHAVGITQVVGRVVGARQVQRGQRQRAGTVQAGRDVAAFAGFHHLTAPAEPQPAGRGQRVAKPDSQAAGSRLARVGHTVGDDDQARHQITVSQGADRRTAPLISPTIE